MSWMNFVHMPWMQLQTTLEQFAARRAGRHKIYSYPGVNLYHHMLDILHTCDKGTSNVTYRKNSWGGKLGYTCLIYAGSESTYEFLCSI